MNPLVLVSLSAMLAMPLLAQTRQPETAQEPRSSDMTLKGCLRSEPANPNNPDDKRVIYTLEVNQGAPVDRSPATGTSGRAQADPKKKVQLSADEAKNLSKHVGQEIQVTGELLQPPGTRPGAAEQAMPLPGAAEGTFRVSAVKTISSKCG